MTDLHDAPPEPEAPQGEGELFLDFANTVELIGGLPEDRVPDARALLAWLRERDLVPGRVAGDAVDAQLPAFRDLRELVREITARQAAGRLPTRTQLQRLNAVLREGVHFHELRLDRDGGRFTVGQVGDELAQARAAIAGSLAHYLSDHDVGRLRVCANDGCRWLFIDRSAAGRRRWCDMRTCGNRAKVARHRARRRRGDPPGTRRRAAVAR